jgi:hypothetical protein
MKTFTLTEEEVTWLAETLSRKGRHPILYRFYETLLNDPDTNYETRCACLNYFYDRGYLSCFREELTQRQEVIDTLIKFISSTDNVTFIRMAFRYLDQIIPKSLLEEKLTKEKAFQTITLLQGKRNLFEYGKNDPGKTSAI